MADYDNNLLTEILKRLDNLNDKYHDLDKSVTIISSNLEQHFHSDAEYMERTATILESMDRQLEAYNKELAIHIQGVQEAMRRNDLLEEQLKLLRSEVSLKQTSTDAELKQLNKPITVAKGILWIFGALSVVAGGIVAIQQLF